MIILPVDAIVLASPFFLLPLFLFLAFAALGFVGALEARNRVASIALALLGAVPSGLTVWLCWDPNASPSLIHIILGLPAIVGLAAICVALRPMRCSSNGTKSVSASTEQGVGADSR